MKNLLGFNFTLPETDNRAWSNTVWTAGYVSVAFILLLLLFVIGILRRRHRFVKTNLFAWLPYSLLFFLIPYILGLIRESGYSNGLPVDWALFLFYIHSSSDNVNAFDLDDRKNVRMIFFKDLIQASVLVAVIYITYIFPIYNLPMFLILFLSLLKVAERTMGLMYATCDTPALRSWLLSIAKYNEDIDNHGDQVNFLQVSDPVQGCRYFVGASKILADKIVDAVTVCKIWQCPLLSPTRDPCNHLKDPYLSFSLFWLLLQKFAGFSSYERSHQEAWNLVQDGLLVKQEEYERPFKVIEVELSFLYDFFYSKYFCFYQIGIWWQLKQLLFLGAVSWIFYQYCFSVFAYQVLNDQEKKENIHIYYEIMFSMSVIVITTLFELAQFITFITSRWAKVMIICKYVSRESWNRKTVADFCIDNVAEILCRIRMHESLKPWRRELSQYSLLDTYSDLQFFPRKLLNAINLTTGVLIWRPGRKESKCVKVSNEIKRAVILSLQKHGRKLTNGIASLEASRLPVEVTQKLTWACTKLESDIRVIIVWHIATTICEMHSNNEAHKWDNFMVATSLSKYCAYLFAFAPNLLPGHAVDTDYTCNIAIEDAKRQLKGSKNNIYDRLMEIANHVGGSEGGEESTILQQGAKLGKDLLTEIMDPQLRWEVLAGFWAEMVLFLAPNSGNEMAHAERLAAGGEFITHLWVLLYHAGIVNRDSLGRKDDTLATRNLCCRSG